MEIHNANPAVVATADQDKGFKGPSDRIGSLYSSPAMPSQQQFNRLTRYKLATKPERLKERSMEAPWARQYGLEGATERIETKKLRQEKAAGGDFSGMVPLPGIGTAGMEEAREEGLMSIYSNYVHIW